MLLSQVTVAAHACWPLLGQRMDAVGSDASDSGRDDGELVTENGEAGPRRRG